MSEFNMQAKSMHINQGYQYTSGHMSKDQVYCKIDEKYRTSEEEAPIGPEININSILAVYQEQ